MSADTLNRYVFAVIDEPMCVIDFGLLDINRRFLKSIDAAYFEYVALVHAERLESPDRMRAATALRTAYHHGIETLIMLLGAYIQAPLAVAAWIPRCWPQHLRELVRRFENGVPLITPSGRQRFMFAHLSEAVHAGAWNGEDDRKEAVEGFTRSWSHFAAELSDPLLQDEYNSIKHGFRVGAGGFLLRTDIETEYGVPAPPESMQTVGASEFGTHFYTLEDREGNRASRSALEVRLGNRALNWPIERVLHGLPILAMSIHNVLNKLRLVSGESADTLTVQRPAEISSFDEPWRYSPGVISSSFRIDIPWDEVETCTRESLLRELAADAPVG
jgi:hypothetical protein